MKRALAAAVAGILLVPGVLLADDAVPSVPAAPEPPPSTAPPAAAPSGDGTAAAVPAQPPAPQAQEMAKPAPPKPAAAKKQAKPKTVPVRAAAAGSVTIRNFAFAPPTINVSVGDTVTWTNQDSAPHTATATGGGGFNTGTIKKGQSASHTFSKAGRFAYICAIHPNMHGTVVVAGAATSSSGGGSSAAGSASSVTPSAGAQAPAPSRPTLPNTGLELGVVALLGALFTGGGTALRRIARRA